MEAACSVMTVLEASGLVNTGSGSALTRVNSICGLNRRGIQWSVTESLFAVGIMRWDA